MARLHDMKIILVTQTERAYLVKETEDTEPVWLPKSQCEIYNPASGEICELTAPEWLLTEKGLL